MSAEKHYFRRRLACRNDFCTHCGKSTFTEEYRYLVVLTKFTIPVLPIGFDHGWFCTQCGRDPRGAAPESKIGLLLGIVTAAAFSIGIFFLPFSDKEVGIKWGMRGMFVGFTLILIYRFFAHDRRSYLAARAAVPPLKRDNCPYCSGPLMLGKCHSCDVRVL